MRIKFKMSEKFGFCETECPNNIITEDKYKIMVNSYACHKCINYGGIDVEGRLICKYSEGMK